MSVSPCARTCPHVQQGAPLWGPSPGGGRASAQDHEEGTQEDPMGATHDAPPIPKRAKRHRGVRGAREPQGRSDAALVQSHTATPPLPWPGAGGSERGGGGEGEGQ